MFILLHCHLPHPQELRAVEEFKHVTADTDVEGFLKMIVPICWWLVTVYKPPIFVSEITVVNGALHEKHHESHTNSSIIQSFLFPLVYKDYGGDVAKKARVLTTRL